MWHSAFKPFKQQVAFWRKTAFSGSASMVFMSLAFLSLLLTVNISLSGLQKDLTSAAVEGKELSALESIATGALQDVFATRFYPASNRLNWEYNTSSISATASTTSQLKPIFKNSSFIMDKDDAGLEQVLARYQYVVIGGNPARDPALVQNYVTDTTDAGYNHLVDSESDNKQLPFYVLLKTFGCMNKNTLKLEIKKLYAIDGQPQCGVPASVSGGTQSPDYELKEYDLLAKINQNPSDDSNDDTNKADTFSVEYSKKVNFGINGLTPVSIDEDILLTTTTGRSVTFNEFWPSNIKNISAGISTMGNLERVLLETSSAKTPLYDATSTTNLSIANVPTTSDTPNPKIHLYFRGPMDARSFFGYQFTTAANPDASVRDASLLNIKLTDDASSLGSSLLDGAAFDFNYPAANHVTITLKNRLNCGNRRYTLSFEEPATDIRKGIRDSYGLAMDSLSTVSIQTADCHNSTGSYHPFFHND
jgi:hypothetical protein